MKKITKAQLWAKPYTDCNTIGGIILHVSEHIGRNCLRLSNKEHLLKNGFESYFPEDELEVVEIIDKFETQLNEWKKIMEKYMKQEYDFKLQHIHDLSHLVEHTGYHLGQVIDRIQAITDDKLQLFKKGLNERYLREKIDADKK
ncbi:hypothetical protein J9303_02140 [Bacillaceae bacterium Marseille-Q3522]|nr:hypothetical protein [Bacillaceae bacterium Marseille-Q3522]